MALLTTDKPRTRRATHLAKTAGLQMAPSITIPLGAIVCQNAAGLAVNASDIAAIRVVGIASETRTSDASNPSVIAMEYGHEEAIDCSGTNPILIANVGQMSYVIDNGTVGVSSTNSVAVGVCRARDTVNGAVVAWVSIGQARAV
jgi:hypothetical protein